MTEWLKDIKSYEYQANRRKMESWLLPVLKSNFAEHQIKNIIFLSVGCGFGADVDVLADYGVNSFGIEPFTRSSEWQSNKNKGRLIVADGRNIPFADGTFDVCYVSDVIEHVGYDESTRNVETRERTLFAREICRVVKPGGIIIITTPNRTFGIDIGHAPNFLGLRVHSPLHDFTLSFKDISELFLRQCGCRSMTTLPYRNFASLDLVSRGRPLMRCLSPLLRAYFRILDEVQVLSGSLLSPYIKVAIQK